MINIKDVQLEADINALLKEAIEETTHELLNKLLDYIEQDVYGVYEPEWYERTMGMLECWEATDAEYTLDGLYSTIQYNDEYFHRTGWVDNKWQHNSNIDIDGLIGVITTDNEVGAIAGFPSNEEIGRGNFWADFEKYVEENKDEILRKNLLKRGLVLG